MKELRESSGLSLGDILKPDLNKLEPNLGEAFERRMMEGYEVGYDAAEQEYEVTYWCSRCRRGHLSITTEKEKEAAAELMYQAGWHDPRCSTP